MLNMKELVAFLSGAACIGAIVMVIFTTSDNRRLNREVRRLRADSVYLHKIIIKQNSLKDVCTWCKAVEDYSLNINCKHYEESGDN